MTTPTKAHGNRLFTIIKQNTTLNVPGDIPSIEDALEWLRDKWIQWGSAVTIKVADGTYAIPSTLFFYHPTGNQVIIEGNPTTPSNVVFNCAANGFQFGYFGTLRGFRLVGSGAYNGVVFTGQLGTVEDCEIDGFDLNGVAVLEHGHAHAQNVSVNGSTGNGFLAQHSSSLGLGGTLDISGYSVAVSALQGAHIYTLHPALSPTFNINVTSTGFYAQRAGNITGLSLTTAINFISAPIQYSPTRNTVGNFNSINSD
jgi:hypothetical protein